jgi:transcription initiation factor TFIIB
MTKRCFSEEATLAMNAIGSSSGSGTDTGSGTTAQTETIHLLVDTKPSGKKKPRIVTKKVKTTGHNVSATQQKIMWAQFDEVHKDPPTHSEVDHAGDREHCEHCRARLAINDEGFAACTNSQCAIIYTDVLDFGAEWRYYGADDNQSSDPTRCGMPSNPLLQESSLGIKVLVDSKSSYEMRKIRRYTEWQSMPYREKSQYEDFQRITILADQGGIPKIIIDEAMRYHKKISETKTFRGLNRDGVIAATIYVAARINNYPRTAKEIATIFHLDNTSATRGCKNAVSIINELEHEMENNEKTALCNTTPMSFIDRYCSRLNINAELTRVCQFIANRIQAANMIPENTPHSIAAGIVYFVAQQCNLNVSKQSVNFVSEISEVTINKCYKKLEALRGQLMPQAILQKYNKS